MQRQQAARSEQRGCIRHRFSSRVNAGEAAQACTVMQRLPARQVRQVSTAKSPAHSAQRNVCGVVAPACRTARPVCAGMPGPRPLRAFFKTLFSNAALTAFHRLSCMSGTAASIPPNDLVAHLSGVAVGTFAKRYKMPLCRFAVFWQLVQAVPSAALGPCSKKSLHRDELDSRSFLPRRRRSATDDGRLQPDGIRTSL